MRVLNTTPQGGFQPSQATLVPATSSMNNQIIQEGLSTDDHDMGEWTAGFQGSAEGAVRIGTSYSAWSQLSSRYKYLTTDGRNVINPNTLRLSQQNARGKGYSALENAFPGIKPGAAGADLLKTAQKAGASGVKSAFVGTALKRNAVFAVAGIALDVNDDVTQLKAIGADKETIDAAIVTGIVFNTGVSVASIGAGAYAGVAAGAAVGSVIPVAGTIVGAAVGLLAGVVISLALDHGIANWKIKDNARDALAENMRENEGREPYYLYRDR